MSKSPSSGTGATRLDPQNPWPGLDAFAESDSEFFYGRDDDTAELFRLIKRGTVAVLFGQSGLGKTSLLSAGLYPKLRAANFLPIHIRLDHSTEAPSAAVQVRDAIATAVSDAGAEAPSLCPEATLWEIFHRRDADFWSAKNELLIPVLVFDQFEEIFTIGRETGSDARGRKFLDDLASLVEKRPPAAAKQRWERDEAAAAAFDFERESYKVVLSLREDYLPDLESLRSLIPSVMQHRLRLQRMNGEQAVQAVAKAGAAVVDGDVATKIVQRVAGSRRDAAEAAPDPLDLSRLTIDPALLSLVCRQLNSRRLSLGKPKISQDLLEGSYQEILEKFYDETVADLPNPDPVRVFVEDKLLTRAGYRSSMALDDALAEPELTSAIIDQLIGARLLHLEPRLGAIHVELTHDVLCPVIQTRRDTRSKQKHEADLIAQREQAEREKMAAEEKAQREAGLARKAEEAAAMAEEWRKRADEIIRFMLDDLSDRIDSIGQISVLEDVIKRAVAYYDELSGELETDEVLVGKAKALARRGGIQTLRGRATKALEDSALSLQIYRRLSETDPRHRLSVCWGLFSLSSARATLGDTTGAAADARECYDLAGKHAEGDSEEWGPLLGYFRENVAGYAVAEGELKAAAKLYRETLEERRQLLASNPTNAFHKGLVVRSCIDCGDALQSLGRLKDALKLWEEALQICRELTDEKKGDVQRRYDLSRSCDRVGEALQDLGDSAKAFEAFRESYGIFERLHDHDPENASWLSNYLKTALRLCLVRTLRGDTADVGAALKAVKTVRSSLADIDPGNADAKSDLAESQILLGDHLLAHGDIGGAEAEYRAASDIYAPIATTDSTNLNRQECLAGSFEKLGECAAAQGNFEDAIRHHEKALEIRRSLSVRDSANTLRKAAVAASCEFVGSVLQEQGQVSDAVGKFEEALILRQALAELDPANVAWQGALAAVHRQLGEIAVKIPAPDLARKHLGTSASILFKFYEADQESVRTFVNMIETVLAAGDSKVFGESFSLPDALRPMIPFFEKLTKADPNHVAIHALFARMLCCLATALRERDPGLAAEADEMSRRARDLLAGFSERDQLTARQRRWFQQIDQAASLLGGQNPAKGDRAGQPADPQQDGKSVPGG